MLRCAGGCAGSRNTGRGGGTAVRTPCWPVRGGRSTASGYTARVARGRPPGPGPRRKRQRLGDSTVPASRLTAQRPNHVWALDFQFDQTADGRNLKLLNVVDEYTREALQMLVERRIGADDTVRVLERLTVLRGAPEPVRCDNGPELTAHALRDCCRFSNTATAFVEPGSPWQNPYVESFNGRVRDELLDVEEFSCLAEAKVLIEDWRQDYNRHRPHSALGMLTPAAFAATLLPLLAARPTAAEKEAVSAPALQSLIVSSAVASAPPGQQQSEGCG